MPTSTSVAGSGAAVIVTNVRVPLAGASSGHIPIQPELISQRQGLDGFFDFLHRRHGSPLLCDDPNNDHYRHRLAVFFPAAEPRRTADELASPPELVKHLAAVIDKTAPLDERRLEVEAVARLGGRPEGASQDPATVLRPRELEVFGLIGKGMTSRQIAASLGIGLPTVNTHRQAIASKLGVNGANLVRLATLHNQTR